MASSSARNARSSKLDRTAAKARKAPEKGESKPKKATPKAIAKAGTKGTKTAKVSKTEKKPAKVAPKSGTAEKAPEKRAKGTSSAASAPAKAAPTPKATPAKAATPPKAAPVPAKAAPAPAPKAPPLPPKVAPEPPKPAPIIARGYVPLVDIPKPPPPPSNFQLTVGDKAVHPSHGLAEVTAIEHREIGGAKGEFYIFRILDNGMRVMVPRSSAAAAGIRPVMSAKDADKVLETMRAREVAVDLQPWSRRFRAYTEMIKSGQPQEVAKVLRDMYRLKFDKDLSFGERRLLDQAKSLLMKELASAKKMTEADLQAQVDDMFRA